MTITRSESRLIAFAGAVIVLVVAGFTALAVHQIDQTAHKSSEQHVEQLVQAVTYQLGTMMAGIQQTMRYADDEIREYNTPQKLFELTTRGRVSTHLLRDLLFIDPRGRVVVSGLRPSELAGMTDRSDRDYFRIHLDGSTTDAHIGHPMRGRRTGVEVIPVSYPVRQSDGRLAGVLVALIDVAALERIWVDIGFRPEDRIELIGEDNKVWFSWSGAATGPAAAGSKSWSRAIAGWPMRVVATLDRATVDRESSGPRRAVIASAAVGSMLVGLFCLLLVRRARQAAVGRKAAEAMQARLVASLDAVPVEFIEFDSEKRMIHANHAARLSQNWSSDPTGKTMRELLEDTLAPIRASYPKTEGFVLDITERKVAERELARVRDNLSDAIESMNHGIMLFDRDRRLVLFNRQVLGHYLGPSDLLTIGNKFEENIAAAIEHGRVPVPPGRTAAELIAERLSKFERASGEITERRMPDGRILHISDHRTLSGGTVSMGVDVTERVRIEQRLREVQRMEAIGQLTGGLAHDFNNYLAVVIGNLDLLADCRHDDPEAPKLIEGALAGAQRGAELTRSLLAFSRRQPLNPRSLDVGQRIGDVARLLKRTIGEKITLVVQVAPELWPVEIDTAQLDSAIVNLANNARDAMPDGGTLTLAVRNAEPGIAEQPAGDHLLIEIIDTGRGMDEATQARAFEPFFSTKGPGHGTGLGLSMVHGFVHQSGGTIRLLSAEGRGTTVQLFLPRAARPVARPAPAGAALPRGTESVLVVEDNADVRTMVITQIKSLGYRVVDADNGDAALKLLEARAGEIDLLITDMIMPGEIDGLALARMARERWPKLAILLTTGFSDVIDDGGEGKAADFGVLRKPYRKADIARAMRAALAVGGA